MEHIAQLHPSLQQERTLEPYNHVTLTEEETAEALRLAREKKHYEIANREYWEKVNRPQEFKRYTAEQLLESLGKSLVIDEQNREVVETLCEYFAGDERFEKRSDRFKLSKGIYLAGGVGVGKTTLMNILKQNQHQSFKIVGCRAAETLFATEGDAAIRYLSGTVTVAINSNPFGHQKIGICFDDLGTESEGKHYGKDKNVMTEIILNRYDAQLSGNFTHITTNLSVEELEQRYGTRVKDRLREMMNMITFDKDAPSRRK